MATVEIIRNGLIEKILSINNKDILISLDDLINTNIIDSQKVELTNDQKTILEMSENDIQNGHLISQEAMDNRNLEWLNSI